MQHISPPPADDFDRDLHPNRGAGLNDGIGDSSQAGLGQVSAQDLKAVHRRLHAMSDNDLKQLPILKPGTRLAQGATYVDLESPNCHEFTARGDMIAHHDNWYVPKDSVDYQLWNLLIGVDNPERLGTGTSA